MIHEFTGPTIDRAILERFPDYQALSVVVRGLEPGAVAAVPRISPAPWIREHVEAWHGAFRAFGTNPKRCLPSFEALLKRFEKDGALPRINPVVDLYNVLSLNYGAAFGGEDLDRYQGSPHLSFATGSEQFDTTKNGEPVIECPEAGEVIWRDDAGVTCRRWNWRQCRRTAITSETRNAWFVIDRLPPMPTSELERAGIELIEALRTMCPASVGTATLMTRTTG